MTCEEPDDGLLCLGCFAKNERVPGSSGDLEGVPNVGAGYKTYPYRDRRNVMVIHRSV